MPRYEFSEGSSNKFWDISLSGKSFTTTYGKIGAAGQTTIKKFKSDADAKKEYEKLIAEKVKKGYKAADGANGKPNGKSTKAAKAKADGGGKRYFEMDDKFWEVFVDGNSVKTRFGKIGSQGQMRLKDFKSRGDADKDLESQVAKKVKEGFEEKAGAGGTEATPEPKSNPALEKAILANPEDRDAYMVYADWLQGEGDLRGELMALQAGGKDKQAKKFLEQHIDYFLGPLKEHQQVHDEGWNNSHSHLRNKDEEKEWQKTQREAFLWKNGFIYRCRLSHDEYSDEGYDGETVELLEQVLDHPSGKFIVEFAFQSNGDPNDNDLQDLIDCLGKKAPATTRKIVFGDNVDQISWHHTGNLGKLWKGVPNLETLLIESGEFDVGKMNAPALQKAIFITGGLSKACAKNIATATMPKIKHLEIYFGTPNYGGNSTLKDIQPLLDRTDLTHLEYLGLKNAEFQNELAKAIVGSKVIKKIKTLDLSMGSLTDEGAKALAEGKAALKHLDVLDVSENYLTKEGITALKGVCKKVITDEQRKPYVSQYNPEPRYYVSITE